MSGLVVQLGIWMCVCVCVCVRAIERDKWVSMGWGGVRLMWGSLGVVVGVY